MQHQRTYDFATQLADCFANGEREMVLDEILVLRKHAAVTVAAMVALQLSESVDGMLFCNALVDALKTGLGAEH